MITQIQKLFLLSLLVLGACETKPTAPRARRINHQLVLHGDRRVDPYFWLRNRENPAVIHYLEAENRYTAIQMEPLRALLNELRTEMLSHTDPFERTDRKTREKYEYFYRHELDSELPSYYRSLIGKKDTETKIWSPPPTQPGVFNRAEVVAVSPSEDWLLWAHDSEGRNVYDLHFTNIADGQDRAPPLHNVTKEAVIAPNNAHVLFVRADPQTLRSRSLHCLNLITGEETLIFDEPDEAFSLSIQASQNEKLLFINSGSSQENEIRILRWNEANSSPELFLARRPGHRYQVEDGGDRFFIHSNIEAPTFDIFSVPQTKLPAAPQSWTKIISSSPDKSIEDFAVHKKFLAVQSYQDAMGQLEVFARDESSYYQVELPRDTLSVRLDSDFDDESDILTFSVQSLIQPRTVYNFDMNSRRLEVSSARRIPNFDRNNYHQERIFITARDDEKIPVTLAYAKTLKRDGSAPLFITGYGAYGLNFDPDFDQSLLPLLDRGFVVAIAHIRGGGEYGSRWYDAGRMHKKLNSFHDFIDATEEVLKLKYADPAKVYAEGRSAGGLLMGGVVNMRPDLFRGVIAGVPFVDVLTTMLDESIPLTTGEYTEWGNPNVAADYFYMKGYSPYDQDAAKAYPNLLVTAGLNDTQVPFWEAAKWVAKMRAERTCENILLLDTNMTAGHTGSAERFKRINEDARRLGFFIGLEKGLLR